MEPRLTKSQRKKKKKEQKNEEVNGTNYVLIPLPSLKNEKCSCITSTYIQKEGCDEQGILTKNNFNELRELGHSLLNRLQVKESRNTYGSVISFGEYEILNKLTENDVLYITAHGMASSLGNLKFGVDLSPKNLAKELIRAFTDAKDQLKFPGTLKIMACNSALNTSNEKVYATTSQQKQRPKEILQKSYIEQLKIEIKELAPQLAEQLDICGYLGYISDILNAKSKKDIHTYARFDPNDPGERLIRASDAKITLLADKSTKSEYKRDQIEEKNEHVVETIEKMNKL